MADDVSRVADGIRRIIPPPQPDWGPIRRTPKREPFSHPLDGDTDDVFSPRLSRPHLASSPTGSANWSSGGPPQVPIPDSQVDDSHPVSLYIGSPPRNQSYSHIRSNSLPLGPQWNTRPVYLQGFPQFAEPGRTSSPLHYPQRAHHPAHLHPAQGQTSVPQGTTRPFNLPGAGSSTVLSEPPPPYSQIQSHPVPNWSRPNPIERNQYLPRHTIALPQVGQREYDYRPFQQQTGHFFVSHHQGATTSPNQIIYDAFPDNTEHRGQPHIIVPTTNGQHHIQGHSRHPSFTITSRSQLSPAAAFEIVRPPLHQRQWSVTSFTQQPQASYFAPHPNQFNAPFPLYSNGPTSPINSYNHFSHNTTQSPTLQFFPAEQTEHHSQPVHSHPNIEPALQTTSFFVHLPQAPALTESDLGVRSFIVSEPPEPKFLGVRPILSSGASSRSWDETEGFIIMEKNLLQVDRDIARLLEIRNTKDGVLERELDEATAALRDTFQMMLWDNIEYCYRHDYFGKVWLTHHKVVERYRQNIAQLKRDPSRAVELRKMYKAFTKSLKSQSKFFRGVIQRAICHFGVTQLDFVAREFKFEIDLSDKQRQFSKQATNLATLLVYECLLCLGDLSRYREHYGEPNPSRPNEKDWGPAKGFYSLARKVLPAHPKAFNQLAVLAQYERNEFTSVYYLYRALLTTEIETEMHSTTHDNLKLCFNKILKDQNKLERRGGRSRPSQPQEDITKLFCRYHAYCFAGTDLSEHEGLKSDLLNQITLAVKEKAIAPTTLNRMILINIAAEHLALTGDRASLNSPKVVTYLRFNVETFTSLLMVLQQELDSTTQDAQAPDTQEDSRREETQGESVSAVTRRMLPSLRLYSAWLLISHHILINETNDMSLNIQVKQLWQTYATTLSLMLSAFPIRGLKSSDYVLEEDEDISGFRPLQDISTTRKLGKESANEKERDHPNDESLARILFLIEDGIELCTPGTVPIVIKNDTFAFQDGIISTDSNSGYAVNTDYPTITLRDIPVKIGGMKATSTASRLGQANPMGSVISEPVSNSMTNKMNAMVDDLVGSTHSREGSGDEEEVVVWKGRKAFYQTLQANGKYNSVPNIATNTSANNNGTVTSKTPGVAQLLSGGTSKNKGPQPLSNITSHINIDAGTEKFPILKNVAAYPSAEPNPFAAPKAAPAQHLLTATDLVGFVRNYTNNMAGPSSGGVPQPFPTQPEAATPKLSALSINRQQNLRTPPGMAQQQQPSHQFSPSAGSTSMDSMNTHLPPQEFIDDETLHTAAYERMMQNLSLQGGYPYGAATMGSHHSSNGGPNIGAHNNSGAYPTIHQHQIVRPQQPQQEQRPHQAQQQGQEQQYTHYKQLTYSINGETYIHQYPAHLSQFYG